MLDRIRLNKESELETETLGIGAADISVVSITGKPIEDRPICYDADSRNLSYEELIKIRRYINS
jgi:hypothetical protein